MTEDSLLDLTEISIVHWFDDIEKHKCGYCKDAKGSVSYGMWAESLKVEDYQNLIDRGWRRSGHYCYKPIMDQTCCPQYTIKCCSLDLSLTKSQKKIIKKLNKFLANGELSSIDQSHQNQEHEDLPVVTTRECPSTLLNKNKIESRLESQKLVSDDYMKIDEREESCSSGISKNNEVCEVSNKPKCCQSSSGPDPGKPRCKKAKLLRLERKQKKLETQGKVFTPHTKAINKGKTVEELLNEIPNNGKHSFNMKLIPVSEPGEDWESYEQIEYQLYRKYQNIIHNDDDCSLNGFRRFLVSSPLKLVRFSNSTDDLGYGSFHQQYWIDGKLIAVGVIDILPKCISSVYFFYDPDYRNLTLGTYGCLRELEFTRLLQKSYPSIQYYYMGFYIHSCPKMRYKGKLVPSMLLCPETYSWVSIEKCIPKLDVNKYSRLRDDPKLTDPDQCTADDKDHIKVIVNYVCMFYKMYKKKFGQTDAFNNIATYVGKKCSTTMFFVLSK